MNDQRKDKRAEGMKRSFARRTSENDKRQRGNGQIRRYNNDNVVPRVNGSRREIGKGKEA